MALPPLAPFATQRMLGGRNRDGWGFGDFILPRPEGLTVGIIFHTTETSGVPGYVRTYKDGSTVSVAPHFTLDVANRKWIQDVRLDRRCGTLAGSSLIVDGQTTSTNSAWVIQVELTCYSDKSLTTFRPWRTWVGALPPEVLQMIADFIIWVQSFEPAPQVWYPKANVGTGKKAMSFDRWLPPTGPRWWGVAEHVTSPDASSHWDCGAIDSGRIMELVRATTVPTRVRPSDEVIDKLVSMRIIGPPADWWKGDGPTPEDRAHFNRTVQNAVISIPVKGGFIRRVVDLGIVQPNEQWAIDYWQRQVDPASPEFDKFWTVVNEGVELLP